MTDKELLTKRQELINSIAKNNNKQLVTKILANSLYGACSNEWFRYYDIRIAEAITLSGQLIIRWVEKAFNEFMNELLETKDHDYVIMSDTDSVAINCSAIVDKVFAGKEKETTKVVNFLDRVCKEKFTPYINSRCDELAEYLNAYENKIVMKRENICSRSIHTQKKRYIMNVYDSEGVRYSTPKLKIMGLETARSSTPQYVRNKLKEVIKLIINADEKIVQEFIEQARIEFRKLPAVDVAFPRGVNGIKKYQSATSLYLKGTPIHVRAAILYNHLLREKKLTNKYPIISSGEKIKFLYLKTPNPLKEDVIGFYNNIPTEFELDRYIDYEKQFDKAFRDPIKNILDAIGWKDEECGNLDSFFE